MTLALVRQAFTSTYDPTIEDSYTITRRIDGVEYLITLTDTAGQEEYRGLWAQDALLADGFLLVYDITRRESLNQLEWFESIVGVEAECREERAEADARMRALRNDLKDLTPNQSRSATPAKSRSRRGTGVGRSRRGTNATENPPPMPLPTNKPIKIVAGNKVDLAGDREVPAREGLEWARKHGCGFMETSARERVNVEETFGLIVRRVVEGRREKEQRVMEEEYAMIQSKRAEGRGAGRYAISGGVEEWDVARRATVDWTKEGRNWQDAGGQRQPGSGRERGREGKSRDGNRSRCGRDRTRERKPDPQDRNRAKERKPPQLQLDEKALEREAMRERDERERKLRRRQSESGIALRHAPTAPLSPLAFDADGNEKRVRLPGPNKDNLHAHAAGKKGWAWLRCW